MADIVISGNTSGSVTLRAPDTSGSTVLTLPTTTGTLVVTGGAQTIEFAAGSAASPSITFTGDTNTGIFSPTADTIAFSEGGVESMRIDSAGNVGIGTASPGSFNSFANQLVVGNGSSTQGITVFASNASSISFADGTAGTAPFQGYITYNHVSDYMAFYANYSGSSSPRLLINSNGTTILQGGNLTANGTGITFPATQSASSDANTLDDYEEGTFSPTVIGTTTSGTVTYGDRVGRYTKIGNRVFFTIYVTWSGGTGTGNLRFGNLPFTSANNAEYATLAIYTNNVNYTSGNTVVCFLAPNDTTIDFRQSVPNSSAIGLPYDANVDGFIVSGHYPAA